ncbi:MAG: flagellar hook-basal body complex protein FliE [Vulcanimicrobiaceae bacterium]
MRVGLLVPDTGNDFPAGAPANAGEFAQALDALGDALGGAQDAEDAFASGRGSLQAAVYGRARADVALAVASATAQRSVQAAQSILNMQV